MYSNIKDLAQLRQEITELNIKISSQQKIIRKCYHSSTKMFSIRYLTQQIYHKSEQLGHIATTIRNGIDNFKAIILRA